MSAADIQRVYDRVRQESSDMIGHMSTICAYSTQCPRIVEFGVYDCTSTWALLAGLPERLTSYDIVRRPEVDEVEQVAGDRFQFVLGDSAKVEIDPCDLLFIDSLHTYAHLQAELARHADKVSKFILLHDTTTFGEVDQDGNTPGLWLAIAEFLVAHPEWRVRERFMHCHGLTVLERA